MDTSNANPALFAALAAAQGEIENAAKNAANPHFKSRYADLAEVLNTVRPVFAKNGLSLLQSTGFDGSLVSVTTLVAHKDGGFVTSVASCVPAKSDAQGIGSATTYLRRYAVAAMAGVAQEDDDGTAAAHDRKPAAVSEADQAKAADFRDALKDAKDETELQRIGADLAGAKLPANLLADLRALYSIRHKALAPKAAA
jgi:hypothetical protein